MPRAVVAVVRNRRLEDKQHTAAPPSVRFDRAAAVWSLCTKYMNNQAALALSLSLSRARVRGGGRGVNPPVLARGRRGEIAQAAQRRRRAARRELVATRAMPRARARARGAAAFPSGAHELSITPPAAAVPRAPQPPHLSGRRRRRSVGSRARPTSRSSSRSTRASYIRHNMPSSRACGRAISIDRAREIVESFRACVIHACVCVSSVVGARATARRPRDLANHRDWR